MPSFVFGSESERCWVGQPYVKLTRVLDDDELTWHVVPFGRDST